MDIKINAQGRYVEVTDIKDLSLEEAAMIVYDLWAATELDKEQIKEVNTLTAGGYTSMEKGPRTFGFAYMGSGERLEVK
jgi:ribosome biogenesis SPOUT family RNA methylase Rps3